MNNKLQVAKIYVDVILYNTMNNNVNVFIDYKIFLAGFFVNSFISSSKSILLATLFSIYIIKSESEISQSLQMQG